MFKPIPLSLLKLLSPQELAEYEALVEAQLLEHHRTKLYQAYPETGPLRRELYAKHMQHFAAGVLYNERALLGGNRSGKTFACCYETSCHMTGWYPHWWPGYRFSLPVKCWASGEDSKSVRESLQITYLGESGNFGTGLIPHAKLLDYSARSGVPDAIDSFVVRHASGGASRMLFKSYDQGRESFQASAIDIMQFDEEPPLAIYTEGLTRTMSTVPGKRNGLVICGFTPLKGLSGVVLQFLPGGKPVEGAVMGS